MTKKERIKKLKIDNLELLKDIEQILNDPTGKTAKRYRLGYKFEKCVWDNFGEKRGMMIKDND